MLSALLNKKFVKVAISGFTIFSCICIIKIEFAQIARSGSESMIFYIESNSNMDRN